MATYFITNSGVVVRVQNLRLFRLASPFAPPLVRDRKTLRAMERPAGPAGTRAWHKRPVASLVDKIDRETIMTRARLCARREEMVARLRMFPRPVVRHMMRLGYRIPLDLHVAPVISLRGRLRQDVLRQHHACFLPLAYNNLPVSALPR